MPACSHGPRCFPTLVPDQQHEHHISISTPGRLLQAHCALCHHAYGIRVSGGVTPRNLGFNKTSRRSYVYSDGALEQSFSTGGNSGPLGDVSQCLGSFACHKNLLVLLAIGSYNAQVSPDSKDLSGPKVQECQG